MLKIINTNKKNFLQNLDLILQKRKNQSNTIDNTVKKILHDIKKNKDKALIKYEKKFSKNKNLSIKKIKFY